ncbi:class I SAM-dependent methyltransferase [Rhodospirillales bacterium]|nr:class I SAM-dependent methyltransferase [Rhodospirillales bacterium]
MIQCRCCESPLEDKVIDFGPMPSANAFLSEVMLNQPEALYPLTVYICQNCWLMQIPEFHTAPDMFSGEYLYFSSYAKSWVQHAARFCTTATDRFNLNNESFVVEVASNDGYLLQEFVATNIPCLGIDPAENAAAAALEKGVETIIDFFSAKTALNIVDTKGHADLIVANNVLAHVPDINDFIAGVAILMAPGGVVSFEFPHLARLLEKTQFDTIYDEHFSYLSLGVIMRLFEQHGLAVFDVEELTTHGGSLRVYGRQKTNTSMHIESRVGTLLTSERDQGLEQLSTYIDFEKRAVTIRNAFRNLMSSEAAKGQKIAAFGAAAKGTVFLNYCDVGADAISFVIDDTPAKQGRFIPGVHIPVVSFDALEREKPDLIIILPWNFRDEIATYLEPARAWGARFVVATPKIEVF